MENTHLSSAIINKREVVPQKALHLRETEKKYCIIGGGPAGLASAKNLLQNNIPFDGFEFCDNVGGLWNINNKRSTVYESAHLISSKRMTEFEDFPMKRGVADYPHHSQMYKYFKDYAMHYNIYNHYNFGIGIKWIEPHNGQWFVTLTNGEKYTYKGVLIANGTLSHPNMPKFPGEFTGELLHSCKYKYPAIFEGKRVLIVGAGNSGCDIAVDAVHRAKKVSISVRRGYHFVPKYVFGQPADAFGEKTKMPRFIQKFFHKIILRLLVGNPVRFGFPAPDHELFAIHPIVNSQILYHAGHGDINVKANIKKFSGKTVLFEDETEQVYDMVVLATGYKLHYPFIDKKHLNWNGQMPDLYLNIFHPEYNNLFVMGMIEATGLGWQGRDEQARLVAKFILANEENSKSVKRFIRRKHFTRPDLTGGMNYMNIQRMAYYVHKDTYRKIIRKAIRSLK